MKYYFLRTAQADQKSICPDLPRRKPEYFEFDHFREYTYTTVVLYFHKNPPPLDIKILSQKGGYSDALFYPSKLAFPLEIKKFPVAPPRTPECFPLKGRIYSNGGFYYER